MGMAIVLLLVYAFLYVTKIKKTVRQFVRDVNSGKITVYCQDRICGSSLLDSNGIIIRVADKYAKIDSSTHCPSTFITQCYRAVIDSWYFNGSDIVLYVKPLNNAEDKWYIKRADRYSIECAHPVMSDNKLYLWDNAPMFRAGETVTLRSKVSPGTAMRYQLKYEIVN